MAILKEQPGLDAPSSATTREHDGHRILAGECARGRSSRSIIWRRKHRGIQDSPQIESNSAGQSTLRSRKHGATRRDPTGDLLITKLRVWVYAIDYVFGVCLCDVGAFGLVGAY